ncbi:cytidylyltransferase domain-containing protein [Clostridium arbusti]|uniref:cytidylyltransferase domain-containing protein n=1 Tax=Clostridium arbusti TaxID=1137848 RepID=UPI00028A1039|nr:glycosyltransferase family protein [Clostridium arbusti]
MNIVCIIQARVGSTRLPGKVLKKICGKTVLEHDIDRIKRVKNIDKIVIATTTLDKDDVIVQEAKRLKISFFRGSEDDVLSRYYYAAKENNTDVVVRVTSDCPLIDSEVTNATIQLYLDNTEKYDYVNNTIQKTFPRGLDTEVFSFDVLERAFNEATSVRDREHVTSYIWDNPQLFKLGCYKSSRDYSELRWTLDTIEDLQLITTIYSYLYNKNKNFLTSDIIRLLQEHPSIKEINKGIVQKIV